VSFGLAGRGAEGCQGALKLQQFMPGTLKGQHKAAAWVQLDLTRHVDVVSAVSPDKSLQAPASSSAKPGPSAVAPSSELPMSPAHTQQPPLPQGPGPSRQYHSSQEKAGADSRREITGLLGPTNH